MKTKILLCTSVLLFISLGRLGAQVFDLSSFADDIEETIHKLEMGDKEVEKCYEVYKNLDKSLLNLNEEIIGINTKELEKLIAKKFDAANESFQEIMAKDQYIIVQNLNNKQSKKLIEALIGKKGLIEAHGLVGKDGIIGKKGARGTVSIVVGTCIK